MRRRRRVHIWNKEGRWRVHLFNCQWSCHLKVGGEQGKGKWGKLKKGWLNCSPCCSSFVMAIKLCFQILIINRKKLNYGGLWLPLSLPLGLSPLWNRIRRYMVATCGIHWKTVTLDIRTHAPRVMWQSVWLGYSRTSFLQSSWKPYCIVLMLGNVSVCMSASDTAQHGVTLNKLWIHQINLSFNHRVH